MNKEAAFFACLAGGLVLALLGVGLVISAFVGKKFTKAGRVRAIVGGVLVAVCLAAYLVFVK